jgi:Zn-dependent peptidase ImmA (M78 family)
MAAFRRGFKTWCENASRGFRRDLRLPLVSHLDPQDLARHLEILVWTPHDVARRTDFDQRHLDQLLVNDSSSWSAVTLVLRSQKLIIVNSTHAPVRQNSDIMHELAHIILGHEPARVDMTPQRLMILDTYNKDQEEEADWLSGALLVPRDGLLQILSRDSSSDHAAAMFKVSTKMITWRRQVTGIDQQLRRRTPSSSS